jgi:hypothetical protein
VNDLGYYPTNNMMIYTGHPVVLKGQSNIGGLDGMVAIMGGDKD